MCVSIGVHVCASLSNLAAKKLGAGQGLGDDDHALAGDALHLSSRFASIPWLFWSCCRS